MALTLPSIVPSGYAGTSADFQKTKCDKSGAVRLVTGSVTVPASTASGTIIGLFPFNKGAKVSYGSRVYVADLDTGTDVTLDVGYQYYNSDTGTSQNAGFVSASTAPQAGGMIEMTAVTSMTFTAAGDGWVIAKIGGGATTTEGAITFNCSVAYDPSGVTNA